MPDLVPRGPSAPTAGPAPDVAPNQLPNARMNPDMPLAAAGGGQEVARAFGASQDLADAGVKLQMEERQRQYQIQETDAATKLGMLRNKLQTKAQSAKGQNAFGIREQINDEFTKGAQDIGKDLAPAVQVRFQRHVSYNAVHLDHALNLHEMQESQRVDNETSDQYTQTQMDTARLNAGNDEVQDSSAANIVIGARQWGARNGVPKEVVDAHAAKMVARMYGGTVDSLIENGQDKAAQDSYKKYSDAGFFDGDPVLKDRLAKRMERDTKLGDAQGVGDKVFGDFYDTETGTVHKPPETLDAAMEEGRKLSQKYDPDTRKLIESQIKERWQEKLVAQKDDEDKTFNTVGEQLRKGAKLDDIKKSDVWDSLSEKDKEHYEAVYQKVLKRESPYAPFNNPALLNNITLMSDQDIRDLQKMPQDKFNAFMGRLVPNVTEPTYQAFLNRIKGVDRAAEKPVSFMLKEQEKEDLFSKLKLSGSLDKSESAKNLIDLKRKTQDAQSEFTNHAAEFERRIQDEFVTPEHRLPTAEEFRKMRDQYVMEQIKKNAKESWGTQILRWGLYAPMMSRELGPDAIQERMKRAGIIQTPATRTAGADNNIRPVNENK